MDFTTETIQLFGETMVVVKGLTPEEVVRRLSASQAGQMPSKRAANKPQPATQAGSPKSRNQGNPGKAVATGIPSALVQEIARVQTSNSKDAIEACRVKLRDLRSIESSKAKPDGDLLEAIQKRLSELGKVFRSID